MVSVLDGLGYVLEERACFSYDLMGISWWRFMERLN